MLTQRPTSASVRTAIFCELMVLRAEDFHEVIRDFPRFAELVLEIGKKIDVENQADSPARARNMWRRASFMASEKMQRTCSAAQLTLARSASSASLTRAGSRGDVLSSRDDATKEAPAATSDVYRVSEAEASGSDGAGSASSSRKTSRKASRRTARVEPESQGSGNDGSVAQAKITDRLDDLADTLIKD